ncbi:hypothetical protein AAFC00_003804 [Neodothiora populina]
MQQRMDSPQKIVPRTRSTWDGNAARCAPVQADWLRRWDKALKGKPEMGTHHYYIDGREADLYVGDKIQEQDNVIFGLKRDVQIFKDAADRSIKTAELQMQKLRRVGKIVDELVEQGFKIPTDLLATLNALTATPPTNARIDDNSGVHPARRVVVESGRLSGEDTTSVKNEDDQSCSPAGPRKTGANVLPLGRPRPPTNDQTAGMSGRNSLTWSRPIESPPSEGSSLVRPKEGRTTSGTVDLAGRKFAPYLPAAKGVFVPWSPQGGSKRKYPIAGLGGVGNASDGKVTSGDRTHPEKRHRSGALTPPGHDDHDKANGDEEEIDSSLGSLFESGEIMDLDDAAAASGLKNKNASVVAGPGRAGEKKMVDVGEAAHTTARNIHRSVAPSPAPGQGSSGVRPAAREHESFSKVIHGHDVAPQPRSHEPSERSGSSTSNSVIDDHGRPRPWMSGRSTSVSSAPASRPSNYRSYSSYDSYKSQPGRNRGSAFGMGSQSSPGGQSRYSGVERYPGLDDMLEEEARRADDARAAGGAGCRRYG